jgi:hypothetical protein
VFGRWKRTQQLREDIRAAETNSITFKPSTHGTYQPEGEEPMTTNRRGSDEQLAQRNDVQNAARPVDRAEISQRAYERYEERGREPGHDVDDWLEAERDLRGQSAEH